VQNAISLQRQSHCQEDYWTEINIFFCNLKQHCGSISLGESPRIDNSGTLWPTEEGETNTVHYSERLVGSALELGSEKQTGADGKMAEDGVTSTKTFSE